MQRVLGMGFGCFFSELKFELNEIDICFKIFQFFYEAELSNSRSVFPKH